MNLLAVCRSLARPCLIAAALTIAAVAPARAQEEERPRVGPFVVDLRGAFFRPPVSDQLALSRGFAGLTSQTELPGAGIAATGGVHVYPLRWKAVTFGIGGEVVVARARHAAAPLNGQTTLGNATTETFVSAAPQLSLNFRGSNGWSYISGGIGQSVWHVIPDGQPISPVDDTKLRTVNYGGGARWFIKRHLAFSLDVRIWQVDPGQDYFGYPGSPRANMLIIAAGVSVK